MNPVFVLSFRCPKSPLANTKPTGTGGNASPVDRFGHKPDATSQLVHNDPTRTRYLASDRCRPLDLSQRTAQPLFAAAPNQS